MSNKKRKTSEVVFDYTGTEEREAIPKDVKIVRFHSSVTEVSNDMFAHCKELKEVVFNDGLQRIEDYAFRECTSLDHINLPSTLLEINVLSFSFCTSLEDIILNEGLQKIGMGAFANCRSLESITIPSTVTEISTNAFFNCRRLREVGLHGGIEEIRFTAFEECSSLERFTFPKLSTRLETMIRAGQTEVEDKIDNIRGNLMGRRGSELFVSAESMRVFYNNWKTIREVIRRIDRLITYYELKEATTLLELAIWKSKIDQAGEVKPINRDVYRIDIPGPVRDTILQYLNFRVIEDSFSVEQV